MNFREISNLNPNYYEINREERNYAAILFATLCNSKNLLKFLNRCGVTIDALGADHGVYFEYSFLRDLWFKLDNNEIKKDVIRKLLKIKNIDSILDQPIIEINKLFGASGTPSREHIESPSNWAITKYSDNFDDDDFIKVCRFKWSFNIKPDIIVNIDKDTALCIEAKYESSEGQYPASKKDQSIFTNRKIQRVGQTELQKYMMEELLGIKTKFMFLVSKKAESSSHETINWKEVFEILEISELPNFAKEMIKRISSTAV